MSKKPRHRRKCIYCDNQAIYARQGIGWKTTDRNLFTRVCYQKQFVSRPSVCLECFSKSIREHEVYEDIYECMKANARRVNICSSQLLTLTSAIVYYKNPKAYAEWLANEQKTKTSPNLL